MRTDLYTAPRHNLRFCKTALQAVLSAKRSAKSFSSRSSRSKAPAWERGNFSEQFTALNIKGKSYVRKKMAG